MQIEELEWVQSNAGGRIAVHTDGNQIFLCVQLPDSAYMAHLYPKGGVDPGNPSQSWLRIDSLALQCVLHEVFG